MNSLSEIFENVVYDDYSLDFYESINLIPNSEIAELVSEVSFHDIALNEEAETVLNEFDESLLTADHPELNFSLHCIQQTDTLNTSYQSSILEDCHNTMSPEYAHNSSSGNLIIDPQEHSTKLDKQMLEDAPQGDIKRHRTVFKRDQIKVLENVFNSSPFCSKIERFDLARRLALSERTVKMWFQNRRMKSKKRSRTEQAYNIPKTAKMSNHRTPVCCFELQSYTQLSGGTCIEM